MDGRQTVTEKFDLPKGVEINGKQLRISFMLHGQRCREPLAGIVKINKASLAYADNKRRTILAEIKEGRFDYAAHFPESPRAAMFSGHGGPNTNRTVAEGVARWLEVQKAKKATSTSRNYAHKAKHLVEKFGRRRIVDINRSDLELWQAQLVRSGLAPKTVNDIFTPVRGVWSDAFHDGILKTNPLDRIVNIERDEAHDSADPFTREEMAKIAAVKTSRQDDIAMILFNCWTGLSVSELMAVGVDDFDEATGTLDIRFARVNSEYKVPKEKSRKRRVELIDPALELIKAQIQKVKDLPAVEIEVKQRDNITIKKEQVRFLFRNGRSKEPWHTSSMTRWFASALRRAGVRHRGPNQCRHTFASQALSNYVPKEWLARQLGHTSTTMINKHYARWIPQDSRSMAGMVSQLMGFRAEQTKP